MRTLPTLAGAILTLAAAGAVMAASPSAAPTTTPPATTPPAPVTTPAPAKATPATLAPASSSMSWSAAIKPLSVTTGSTVIKQNANGSGTITVTLRGLRPDTRWTVALDSGTSTAVTDDSRHVIATRTGLGIDRVSSTTFRIHLTADEMREFLRQRSLHGAVILVSDGTNRSAAVFAAG